MKRCRSLVLTLLLLTLALPLWAAQGEDSRDPNNPLDQGGETCATAVAITTIPFCDTGSTAGHLNDYGVPCQTGSVAPDVVYSITPPVTSTLSFSLCGTSYNSALTIWRGCPSQGGVLVCCSDNVCGDDACCSGVTLAANNTYFVVVDGGLTPHSGPYQFNVVQGELCPSTPCQDTCTFPNRDFETNNLCSGGGGTLMCGDTVCGDILGGNDTQDYYYFQVAGPGCRNVSIDVFGNDTPGYWPFGQGLDPSVYIYSAACDTVYAADGSSGVGNDARIDSVCLEPGIYRLLVVGNPVATDFGPYVVAINCGSCQCTDTCIYANLDIEPNNTCANGGEVIACGDTLCGDFTSATGTDYYTLRVVGTGCYRVKINVFGDDTPGFYPFGRGLDPFVGMITGDCAATITFDDTSGVGLDPYIEVCVPAGTYKLFINNLGNGTAGPYILATACEPCECPGTCPYPNRDNEAVNNTCGTFNPPTLCGDTLCGNLLSPTDNHDWYLLTVVGPGLTRVTLDVFADDTPGYFPFGQGLDPLVRLVGNGCTTILGVDTAGGAGEDARLEICVPQGSYNIQVQQEDFTSGPYILAISCAPCDTCPYPSLDIEPINDNCGTQNPLIHCNDALCGEITQDHGINDDWYLLQITQCTQLFIDILGDDTPGFYPFGRGLNTAAELWRADCQQMLYQDLNSGVGEDAQLNTPCLEPGFYMLRVFGEGLTEGPYILFIGCESCTCNPPCEVPCPQDARIENEPCPGNVDTTNGGCDTDPQNFLEIGCDVLYCGTSFSNGVTSDQDWYFMPVLQPTQVRLCVSSEFDGTLSLYSRGPGRDGCENIDLVECTPIAACQGFQCLSVCLSPGVYFINYEPQPGQVFSCWNYLLGAVCSDCEPARCEAPDSVVIHFPDTIGVGNELEDIALYWPPVPGVDEYRIYRTSDPVGVFIPSPFTYVATTNDTFFVHEDVIPLGNPVEEYIYYVVGYCRHDFPPCDVVPTVVTPPAPDIIMPRE